MFTYVYLRWNFSLWSNKIKADWLIRISKIFIPHTKHLRNRLLYPWHPHHDMQTVPVYWATKARRFVVVRETNFFTQTTHNHPQRETRSSSANTDDDDDAAFGYSFSAQWEKSFLSARRPGWLRRLKEKSCFCLSSSSCEPPLCFHFSPRSGTENCFAHSLHRDVLISHNDHQHQPSIPHTPPPPLRASLLFRKATIFSPIVLFHLLFVSVLANKGNIGQRMCILFSRH